MNNINDLVLKFICEVKLKYENLIIGYEYNEECNLYDIWHNNRYLEFEDIKFSEFIGDLIAEVFYNNKVFNVAFGYDYEKTKQLEQMGVLNQCSLIIEDVDCTMLENVGSIWNGTQSVFNNIYSTINYGFNKINILPTKLIKQTVSDNYSIKDNKTSIYSKEIIENPAFSYC